MTTNLTELERLANTVIRRRENRRSTHGIEQFKLALRELNEQANPEAILSLIKRVRDADIEQEGRMWDELEAVQNKVDAERYRWLRDVGDATWRPFGIREGYSAEKADAAIDAAIQHAKDKEKAKCQEN